MAEHEKEQSFKVTDKRSSSREEGAEEQSSGAQTQKAASEPTPQTEPREQEQSSPSSDQTSAPPFPEPNLLTLVFSLYTHTQICLGVLPDPITQKQQKDLQQAQYNIDMLGMLKTKTEGNLTDEEEQTLETILYEVRMNYVEASK